MKAKIILIVLYLFLSKLFIYINCQEHCIENQFYKGGSCYYKEYCDYYSYPGGRRCYDYSCPTNLPYHNYNSRECIYGCSGEYSYYDENGYNICYKKEQCSFIYYQAFNGHNVCFRTKLCSSTTDRPKHNFDSNICIPDCEGDRLYKISGGNICYPSCKFVLSGNYVYEYGHICRDIRIQSICPFYNKKIDGVYNCSTLDDCINNNYKYLIGAECRDNCDGYFKLELKTNDGKFYYECHDTLQKALSLSGILYYNIKSKLLWRQLPNGYYINKISSNKYEVVEECDNYFYIDTSNVKYCTKYCLYDVNNSPNSNHKYFVSGNKKCESACTNFNPKKYYYDQDTYECLDTCEGRVKRFQNEIVGGQAEACLPSCDVGHFYDYDSNICLLGCSPNNPKSYPYYAPLFEKKCYPSCADVPGGLNIYEKGNQCDTSQCAPNSYYYIKKDGVIKCTDAETCYELDRRYFIGYQCVIKCDNYYKLEVDNIIPSSPATTFFKCYESPSGCLGGLTGTNLEVFYHESLKLCWKDYQPEYYINKKTPYYSNIYELVNECEYFYYQDGGRNYCTSACNKDKDGIHQNQYSDAKSKKCEISCLMFNPEKYYYDPDTNECLETCKGLVDKEFAYQYDGSAHECIKSCDSLVSSAPNPHSYYDYDSNICLVKCGDNDLNKKYHAMGGQICYKSCAEIPGDIYIYELIGINDYKCLKKTDINDLPNHYIYYPKGDGTMILTMYENDCKDNGYNYIYEDECRNNCDNYFKFMDEAGAITKR